MLGEPIILLLIIRPYIISSDQYFFPGQPQPLQELQGEPRLQGGNILVSLSLSPFLLLIPFDVPDKPFPSFFSS